MSATNLPAQLSNDSRDSASPSPSSKGGAKKAECFKLLGLPVGCVVSEKWQLSDAIMKTLSTISGPPTAVVVDDDSNMLTTGRGYAVYTRKDFADKLWRYYGKNKDIEVRHGSGRFKMTISKLEETDVVPVPPVIPPPVEVQAQTEVPSSSAQSQEEEPLHDRAEPSSSSVESRLNQMEKEDLIQVLKPFAEMMAKLSSP